MDKLKFRSVILHLSKSGRKPKQIHDELVTIHGEDAPSASTVKYWCRKFVTGHEDIEDEARSGRPITAVSDSLIDRIAKIISENRKTSIRILAQETNSSYGTVHKIIHKFLKLEKKFARWVPHNLEIEQKMLRVEIARNFLKQRCDKMGEFKARMITSDETWISYHTPDDKNSSWEWCAADEPAPERSRIQKEKRKTMATVWWDCQGLIFVDFFKQSAKRGMSSDYYCSMLRKLREELPKQRRGALKRGPLILIDNAPIHKSVQTRSLIENIGFELIPHPPYSPDLAPSDFYLFRNLKSWLKQKRFTTQDDLEAAVLGWFQSKPKTFYEKAIDELKERMSQVIELEGSYLPN